MVIFSMVCVVMRDVAPVVLLSLSLMLVSMAQPFVRVISFRLCVGMARSSRLSVKHEWN